MATSPTQLTLRHLVISFDVLGIPKPQGSKTAFSAHSGKAMMRESAGLGFAQWRNAVAEAALRNAPPQPLDGALWLIIAFRFPMPASRCKADRDRGWAWKTTAPDLSKLVRAVEDGLQAAGLIRDDARIVKLRATKKEFRDEWTGASIQVGPAREIVA